MTKVIKDILSRHKVDSLATIFAEYDYWKKSSIVLSIVIVPK